MKLTARSAGSLAVTMALPVSIAAGLARTTAQHPGPERAITASGQASPLKAIRWGDARFIAGAVTRNIVSFDTAVKEHVDLRMVFMNWGSTAFPATEIRNNAAVGAQSVLELMPRNKSLIGIGDAGNTIYNVAA